MIKYVQYFSFINCEFNYFTIHIIQLMAPCLTYFAEDNNIKMPFRCGINLIKKNNYNNNKYFK